MKKEEIFFLSRDGKTKIHAVKWIPEGKPICILQIVHGMAEYIERYERLASVLQDVPTNYDIDLFQNLMAAAKKAARDIYAEQRQIDGHGLNGNG